ncbi:MAG: SH3 domain-containing protein [Archangium sp.]|nr:SH3 domain-containing protein [Archangium sp.]MDP3156400.1 SH3 domain-containing protein [Archangium sp.]MDP3573154.1 SH3 domain-containing protein [Archangium sp.]
MNTLRLTVLSVTVALMGCAGTAGETAAEGDLLTGAEEFGTLSSELSTGVALGSTLRTSANLNLRTSASMNAQVRLVIPSGATVTTVNVTQPSGGWYNIKYNGVTGWGYGTYLTLVSQPSTGGGTTTPSTTGRDGAILRAKGGVGFSYWWGHGRWINGGATSSNKGACTGSCPSCSHSGSYGADCSGYVAKAWQIPSTNTDVSVDSHPYGTIHFIGSNSQWSTVSRANAAKGDAFVYNTNGAGHILLYESGDAWGSLWAYEARGCSYGIVHNLRSVTSAFKVIRRTGY